MTKKKKSTHQPPEIQMASNTDIKIITGIKLKYLSEKINEYGTNHFFAVLDETILKELIELENIKMPIWEYNDKYYLEINAEKLKEVQVENALEETILILWIYRLVNTIFRRVESRLQVIVFLKFVKLY